MVAPLNAQLDAFDIARAVNLVAWCKADAALRMKVADIIAKAKGVA